MTTEIATRPVPAPERVGQHTAVEMSRAVAEVYAQVQIARDHPRDEQVCRARMLKACASLRLADRAFYNFPRAGETVTGMTIHVAVALARCWGNLLHGLAEMSRDDVYGQSEMQAFCWELETNERHSQTFFVQHVRYAKKKATKLDDPRDIQDNNTNTGNRRWREAIFKALPVEFVEEAEKTLRETLRAAVGAESIEEAREKMLQQYRSDFGISRGQLEHKMRRPVEKWKVDQLIELRILGGSIKRREISLQDAFPSTKVTVEELAEDAQAPAAKASTDPEGVQVDEAWPAPAPGHLAHPEGERWMDGCPGCIAESVAADQAAEDEEAPDADA